jgi:acyl CoA:acetate/3-ketoacid CoA transferase alpha subunit/acyl CoA:acetate/3-ketoacid CoA transferase beta subunit
VRKLLRVEAALAGGDPLEGGKVTTLAAAVAGLVRPGYSLQIGSGLGYPMALLYEIIRQFWGGRPGFTFIAFGGSATNLVPFLQGGLVNKVLAAFMGDPYPFPSPNPLVQKAFAEGTVAFEEWSMLTLTQRLAAGAMGLPFFPTRSLTGSSLTEGLSGYQIVTDPFSGSPAGVVAPLNPDLSLVHGWMADPEGNTVLNLPLVGNVYGPLAARQGAIVTVERVVSALELARFREHVRIPAGVVRAVVEVPFGAHPSGHHHFPQRGDEWGYAEDREFIVAARKACKSEALYREWLDSWILGCPDHQCYLQKLGAERLYRLKGQLDSSTWPLQFLEDLPDPGPPTPAEQMIITAAGEIEKIASTRDYNTILAGVGASHLAAWLAYYSMLAQGRDVALLAEIGLYGYRPLPGDPFVFALRNFPTCRLYADILQILGCHVSGYPGRHCLGVLGAGQVDRRGNINSSQIPAASLYLVGSGGGNDVASGAAEVVVVAEQSLHRFVEQVPFITSPGEKVRTVVSQMGIFRKDPDSGYLKLAACRQGRGNGLEQTVRQIREQCGWDLELFPNLEALEGPATEELNRLRCLDPDRFFIR